MLKRKQKKKLFNFKKKIKPIKKVDFNRLLIFLDQSSFFFLFSSQTPNCNHSMNLLLKEKKNGLRLHLIKNLTIKL